MLLQFRQGLVRYQIDIAGTATFVRESGNGENIDLVCDNAPVIFTVAHLNSDYLVEIPKTVYGAWTGLTATGLTQYLFFDVSVLDASLTFGYTLLPPFVSTTAPTNPAPDQHWFDTANVLMKVWNGNKWIPKLRVFAATYESNATLVAKTLGTQVGLNTPCNAGNILFSTENNPLVSGVGTFITTESGLLAKYTSAEPLKLEATQLYAEALEQLPRFSFITFAEPKKARLAGPLDSVNGMMLEDYFPGEVGNVVTAGLVRNGDWTFDPADINKTLYIGPAGTVSLEPLHHKTFKVGYIYDVDAIVIQLQLITDAASLSLGLAAGDGITLSTVSTTTTISLTPTGVGAGPINTSATQHSPVSIDQYGRITSVAAPIDITPAWSAVLNTPTTLAGYGITDAVQANFSIVPGTATKISYDEKGLVTAGQALTAADIPDLDWFKITTGKPITLLGYGIIDAQPLHLNLTSISQVPGATGLLRQTSPGNWDIDTSTYLSANEVITLSGDVTGSGSTSIAVTLADTGVLPGTYTRLEVDSKGRILTASNPNTLAGMGIADAYTVSAVDALLASKSDINHTHPVPFNFFGTNGIGVSSNLNDITITLQATAVTPGTYNEVTVDSTGRVTSANARNYAEPLMVSAYNDAMGYQLNWSTYSIGFSANFVITDFIGAGTPSSPGVFGFDLRDSGVTPGTYSLLTVDAKGRVTSGSTATTLAGYGITDAYTKAEVDLLIPTSMSWTAITSTPITLAGYGITDAYTKTEVDNLIVAATNVDWANITSIPTTVLGYGITDVYTKTEVDNLIPVSMAWMSITGTPSNLAGYGITDAYTKTEVNNLIPTTMAWTAITSTPITLAGYGITDAYTKTDVYTKLEVDALIPTSMAWTAITSTPITIAGYGITDVYTKTEVYTKLEVDNLIPATMAWTAITATPTTLADYGITDAYTKLEVDALIPATMAWTAITATPTTLAGYGITDAYTKTDVYTKLEVDNLIPATMAWTAITATPTTLAGYGITDAYTKIEVDNLIPATMAWTAITATPSTLSGYGITDALPLTGGTVTGAITMQGAPIISTHVAIPLADIDTSIGSYFSTTITGATALTFSNPPAAGLAVSFTLEITNGGSAAVTWPATVRWAGGTPPSLTTAGVDILSFYTIDSGANWRGSVIALDSK